MITTRRALLYLNLSLFQGKKNKIKKERKIESQTKRKNQTKIHWFTKDSQEEHWNTHHVINLAITMTIEDLPRWPSYVLSCSSWSCSFRRIRCTRRRKRRKTDRETEGRRLRSQEGYTRRSRPVAAVEQVSGVRDVTLYIEASRRIPRSRHGYGPTQRRDSLSYDCPRRITRYLYILIQLHHRLPTYVISFIYES